MTLFANTLDFGSAACTCDILSPGFLDFFALPVEHTTFCVLLLGVMDHFVLFGWEFLVKYVTSTHAFCVFLLRAINTLLACRFAFAIHDVVAVDLLEMDMEGILGMFKKVCLANMHLPPTSNLCIKHSTKHATTR